MTAARLAPAEAVENALWWLLGGAADTPYLLALAAWLVIVAVTNAFAAVPTYWLGSERRRAARSLVACATFGVAVGVFSAGYGFWGAIDHVWVTPHMSARSALLTGLAVCVTFAAAWLQHRLFRRAVVVARRRRLLVPERLLLGFGVLLGVVMTAWLGALA